MRPRAHGCLGYCLGGVAEARSETLVKVSSPANAKAGDPVSRAARLSRGAAAYWIPAGACHRARRRRDPVVGMKLNDTSPQAGRGRDAKTSSGGAAKRRLEGWPRKNNPPFETQATPAPLGEAVGRSSCSTICRKSLVAFSIG